MLRRSIIDVVLTQLNHCRPASALPNKYGGGALRRPRNGVHGCAAQDLYFKGEDTQVYTCSIKLAQSQALFVSLSATDLTQFSTVKFNPTMRHGITISQVVNPSCRRMQKLV